MTTTDLHRLVGRPAWRTVAMSTVVRNHFPDPGKSLRETNRVLLRGGRLAFSMWCAPGKSKFHELVVESIRAHGTTDVPLPPGPPPFRFSDPAICVAELIAAGFDD